MNDLTLRAAVDSDSELAYLIKKRAFKEYVEQVWGWDEKEQRKLHERRFASQEFSVIQCEGTDVGIMAIVYESEYIRLNQLFLLPEYQSKGLGAVCMKLIIGRAAESELPVRLQVLKVNQRALAFFQRFGFRRVGESETHFLLERPH